MSCRPHDGDEVFSFLITQEQLIDMYRNLVGALPEGAEEQVSARLAPILALPDATRSGLPRYPTFFAKVAALLRAIVYERPFPEGNRRVAWECARHLLHSRGYRLAASGQEIDQLMAGAEVGFISVHRIALWLKGHATREG